MKRNLLWRWMIPGCSVVLLILLFTAARSKRSTVDFSTEIKPLLNNKCIACHGGVKKSGGFSLLFEEEAFMVAESGKIPIIPGDPDQSEMIKRIKHHDEEIRMPLESEPLSEQEINLLSRWIEEGAQWGKHWAYEPITAVKVPSLSWWDQWFKPLPEDWESKPIDQFVYKQMKANELRPSPKADKTTLMKRLCMDLTGLPPSLEQLTAFEQNPSEEAYEQLVDSLLASPTFGEKWASMWMDLARYADTKGYERDPHREIWQYRDWLIDAFNEDIGFDNFTIEQLAGDLLADPGPAQYKATAFHRNTMNNDEGGTDNEEYRVASVLDRVNTTWEVWMGTSFGCVQCHSHPYDPFTHEEYYQFMDFFNNQRDEDTFNETPNYKDYEAPSDSLIAEIKGFLGHEEEEQAIKKIEHFIHITEPKIHPHYCDTIVNGTHSDTKVLVLRNKGYCRIPGLSFHNQGHLLINGQFPPKSKVTISIDSLNGPVICQINGNESHKGIFTVPIKPVSGKHELFIHYHNSRSPQTSLRWTWMMLMDPLIKNSISGEDQLIKKILKVLNSPSKKTPILVENPYGFRRKSQVFERGNWLVKGKEVNASTPLSLPELNMDSIPNRLDLAKWMVSPSHPLTARVAVNRFWEQIFGIGLVETLEDFGSQGMPPSHPELLDYLSFQFMHSMDWSVKQLLKTIVMSSTYQQSSIIDQEIIAKDPYNRWLARGPRVRLSAEQVRDKALAVSGLLSDKIKGPSVMPPQPEGVWQVVYNGSNWKTSEGSDRYRRAIYTYWRRTSPYPSMISFDAPSREYCVARRIRTNTPLQALVMLNDPVYIEAAQAIAQKASEGRSATDALAFAYQVVMGTSANAQQLAELTGLYHDMYDHYLMHTDQSCQLIGKAEEPDAKIAAMVTVANTLLNLDEFITKS